MAGDRRRATVRRRLGSPDVGRTGEASKPSPIGTVGATLCFGICALAVAFGTVVIIFGNQIVGT
jgi:hypothetical protein